MLTNEKLAAIMKDGVDSLTMLTLLGKVAKGLSEYAGERCPDFEPDCVCCKVWQKFDELCDLVFKGL